jgi:hypothetical protein
MPPKIVNVVSTRGSDRRCKRAQQLDSSAIMDGPFVDGGYEQRTPSKEFLMVVLGKSF